MDFEPIYSGFESRESHDFFIYFFYVFFGIIVKVQICKCLYSDSPTLLPLMMPRPPAPSAFDIIWAVSLTIKLVQKYRSVALKWQCFVYIFLCQQYLHHPYRAVTVTSCNFFMYGHNTISKLKF